MSQETSHLEFAPPEDQGGGRSLALALFIHILLLMALTWGIHWRTDPQDDAVDAELWSAIPEPVALKSDAPAPPKTQPNEPARPIEGKKDFQPLAKIPDAPAKNTEPPVKNAPDPDIALEKLKKKELAEQLAMEKKAEKLRKIQELEAEKERKAALLQEEASKRKEEEAKRKVEEARRKEEEIRLRKEEETKRKEEEAHRKEEESRRKQEEARRLEQEAKEAEDQRQKQIKRLKSLGATSSGPVDPVNESTGGGKPSDSYLGRLRARVKPNITFSETQLQTVRGNPAAEVEVICSPSGQIVGMKLTQSSGNDAWDQAVLKAIEKTGTLPRDENGKIPSKIPFVFRPRD